MIRFFLPDNNCSFPASALAKNSRYLSVEGSIVIYFLESEIPKETAPLRTFQALIERDPQT